MTPEEIRLLLGKSRQKKRISQSILADRINTQQSHISDMESGKSNPSLATLVRWAEALGYEVELRLKNDTTN
jgi:transcriptional regulator with XRE-family HTH domain